MQLLVESGHRETTFAKLSGSLLDILRLAEAPTNVLVRTVALRNHRDQTWGHFVTTLRPADDVADPQILEIGDVILVSQSFPAQNFRHPEDFAREITRWQLLVGAPSGYQFQETTYVDRRPNRNRQVSVPCLEADLYERNDVQSRSVNLRGPFFDVESNIFAESIGELATIWTSEDFSQQHNLDNKYHLLIPDRRAWIEAIDVDAERCMITVTGSKLPDALFCALTITTYAGGQVQRIVPVVDGVGELELSEAPRTLSVHLITQGEVLDTFRENENGSSWRLSVLHPNRVATDERYATLTEALLAGENDRIEFKASIAAAKPDNKSVELLETIVAFANARGGAVYIGVTDKAEPKGVNRFLSDTYQKEARGEMSAMMDLYLRDLRKMISEGIDPSVDLDFEWIDVAKQLILRIGITARPATIHSVVQSGEIFIRAGGTNRKTRHADALSLVRTRWSTTSLPGRRGLLG